MLYNKSDLGIGYLGMTWARSQVVEYTASNGFGHFRFLQKKPDKQVKFSLMYEPFSFTVWMLILGCIILMSILYYITYKFYNHIGNTIGLHNDNQMDTFVLVALMPIIGEGK